MYKFYNYIIYYLFHFQRSKDLAVTNIAFNIEDEVKEMSGSVGKMIPNHIELIHKIRTEVVDFFTGKQSKTSQTQTDSKYYTFFYVFFIKSLYILYCIC